MKRITIITYGTRGDVVPLLNLAKALRENGYCPTVVLDREYEADISTLGIEYFLYDLQLKNLFQSEQGRKAIESEFRAQSQREVNRQYHARIRAMLDLAWQASQSADLLIYQGDLFAPCHIAEALRIPCIMTSAVPNLSPTRAFPLIGAPWIGDIKMLNRLSYLLYSISWFQVHPRIRAWCEETLNINAPSRFVNYFCRDGAAVPVLYSYSEALLPTPKDWNNHVLASGFWHLDGGGVDGVSPEIEAFLGDGEPAVYFGFGSTVGADPKQVANCVVEAVNELKIKAVVNRGWGCLQGIFGHERMIVIDHASFDWLFSRVSAVVCHGGIGTIAHSLKQRTPLVLCPFITDQYFWSQRMEGLGAGIQAASLSRLTAPALCRAIEQVAANPNFKESASRLGDAIEQENGIGNAIQFIERYLPG